MVLLNLEVATDAELLRSARADADAFAVFYRRHERLVVGWLVQRTGRADLAADLAAEVFAAAYLASERFREGPEPAAAWLLGIARNKLRTSIRRAEVERRARRRLGMERIALDDAALQRVEALDTDLIDLLQDLPPELRDAVRARVIDERDYRDVAARMNISDALARKRVSRGLAALRGRLEGDQG